MFAVLGITGQVGGATARALLAQGKQVRGVVRNPEKAASWKKGGVTLALADVDDSAALTEAFRDVEGVFAMIPPNFAPSPDFDEARKTIRSLKLAIEAARPPKVVYLSSVGSEQTHGLGLITSTHMLETEVGGLGVPSAFLRAGWFMENSVYDIQSAKFSGEIDSYLQPEEKQIAMVATEDIGATAAKTLGENWTGNRVIEVAGPRDYSARDLAAAFTAALGRPVLNKTIPREAWPGAFIAQGMPEDRTQHRIAMLEGLNSGWIRFGAPGAEHVQGTTELETVIRRLVANA